MKSSLLILVGFFIAAILASMLSLSYWSSQRERPVDRMYVIDDSSFFYSQNSSLTDGVVKDRVRVIDDPNDPYGQKLRETLAKYNVSRKEWETNTGNAWTYKWEIIKELNQWQMENN